MERTPDAFVFDVKAYSFLTQHPTAIAALPKDLRESLPASLRDKRNFYYRDAPPDLRDEIWRRFESALLPLDSAGKLGVVLFQFPPWFLPSNESRAHIAAAQQRLPQYRVAVEFRNNRWLSDVNRERTLAFLRAEKLPLVCVDEPQGLPNSVPPVVEATASVALVRFHGRNTAAWAKRGATTGERFDYLYDENELREWLPGVKKLAAESREVHLLMNNCVEDKAVVNARQLALMVEAA